MFAALIDFMWKDSILLIGPVTSSTPAIGELCPDSTGQKTTVSKPTFIARVNHR